MSAIVKRLCLVLSTSASDASFVYGGRVTLATSSASPIAWGSSGCSEGTPWIYKKSPFLSRNNLSLLAR